MTTGSLSWNIWANKEMTNKTSRKASGLLRAFRLVFCLGYSALAASSGLAGAGRAAGRRRQMSASYWAMVRSELK